MLAQSFGGAHKDSVCVHKGECMRVYMSACVCTDAQKKDWLMYVGGLASIKYAPDVFF